MSEIDVSLKLNRQNVDDYYKEIVPNGMSVQEYKTMMCK